PHFLVQSQTAWPLADSRKTVASGQQLAASIDRGEGFERSSPGSKPGSLPLADPRIFRSQGAGIRNQNLLTPDSCLLIPGKSALWESNPPQAVWKTAAFADRPRAPRTTHHSLLTTHHSLLTKQRKGRESNPQGLAARPFSRRLPSPV